MSDGKRYDVTEKYIGTGEYVGAMVESATGDWVEFTDYDALCERLERETGYGAAIIKGLFWNQDGPEAAAAIRELREDVERLRGLLQKVDYHNDGDLLKRIRAALAGEKP